MNRRGWFKGFGIGAILSFVASTGINEVNAKREYTGLSDEAILTHIRNAEEGCGTYMKKTMKQT